MTTVVSLQRRHKCNTINSYYYFFLQKKYIFVPHIFFFVEFDVMSNEDRAALQGSDRPILFQKPKNYNMSSGIMGSSPSSCCICSGAGSC